MKERRKLITINGDPVVKEDWKFGKKLIQGLIGCSPEMKTKKIALSDFMDSFYLSMFGKKPEKELKIYCQGRHETRAFCVMMDSLRDRNDWDEWLAENQEKIVQGVLFSNDGTRTFVEEKIDVNQHENIYSFGQVLFLDEEFSKIAQRKIKEKVAGLKKSAAKKEANEEMKL